MDEAIVKKLDYDDLSLGGFAEVPDLLTERMTSTPIRIPIKVELETEEGIPKRARVTPGMKGYSVFELLSDEGTSIPLGTDSAPAPLDYFAAGAAFCLASHLTLLIHQKQLEVRGFEMESEVWFGYSQEVRGHCLGVRTLVDIDTDEPVERVRELVGEAKGLCLGEAALADPVPIQTAVNVRGALLDPDVRPTSGTLRPPDDAEKFIQ